MTKFFAILTIVLAGLFGPSSVSAQTPTIAAPSFAFCDPLLSTGTDEDEGEEEEIEQTRRYDLEQAERLTTREQIMDALFEEQWNFETSETINRHELCSAEPSYVVLWTKLVRFSQQEGHVLDAEGYMSIRKDGTFELVFAKRPYRGTWQLDGLDMVLTANWLSNGQPYRAPVDKVTIPVEATDPDGGDKSFVEEMYRLGGFRFYRLATTVKGDVRNCACENLGN